MPWHFSKATANDLQDDTIAIIPGRRRPIWVSDVDRDSEIGQEEDLIITYGIIRGTLTEIAPALWQLTLKKTDEVMILTGPQKVLVDQTMIPGVVEVNRP